MEILQQLFFLLGVGFRFGKLDVGFKVARERGQLGIGRTLIFSALALLQDVLGFFLIAPETGIRNAFFQRFQAGAIRLRVKDNS
jgi:hypothetical protein